jgi:hypothetical protein
LYPFPQAKLIRSLFARVWKTGVVIAAMRAGGVGAFPIPMKTISHVFRGANLFSSTKPADAQKKVSFRHFHMTITSDAPLPQITPEWTI